MKVSLAPKHLAIFSFPSPELKPLLFLYLPPLATIDFPSLNIEDTDNYCVVVQKSLRCMFETTTNSVERPLGNPTFEDDQGNICLSHALL